MAIIEKFNFNQTIEQKGKFETKISSRVADYFDYIYTYPPKVKIKWKTVDDLNKNPSKHIRKKLPLADFKGDWFVTDTLDDSTSDKYISSQYSDGYLEKINSSNFFNQKTKTLQTAVSNIPIYVILNGHGEIALNKPANLIGSKTLKAYIDQSIYDYCGAFDKNVERRQQLGLFFMDRHDAETYLEEIARVDAEGTQTVGLSVHCIGLDSAYKVTREHHSGIDFRFVPKFTEVKNLLEKNITKSSIIVEKEQQQAKNEYFKGVPIYLVQVSKTPKNFITGQYFNILGKLDGFTGRLIKVSTEILGIEGKWIMQGSLKNAKKSDKFVNYVFFEKNQASDFIKNKKKNISNYIGGRTKNLGFLVQKPKIFVYNLEDFLEDWEDKINTDFAVSEKQAKSIFDCKATYFVAPTDSLKELIKFNGNSQNMFLKKFTQTLNVKFKVLKNFVGIFFSVN